MRKTNIRVNNNFIIKDKKKYFLSNISDLSEWKSIKMKDVSKGNDITNDLKNIMNQNNIKSNVNFVNFIDTDEIINKSGG